MSNANIVAGFATQGTLRNQLPSLALAATTETIFPVGVDVSSTTNCFVTPPLSTLAYGSQTGFNPAANGAIPDRSGMLYGLPSGETNQGYPFDVWVAQGRLFYVRVSGVGNAGANGAQSVIINLYQGTSATLASDKKIGTTGSALATVAGGAYNFFIEATLLWDSTSQILSGSYEANIAFGSVSQYTTRTVVPNVVTSVTAAKLSFLATVTMGNAAASTAQLTEFVIERV